MQDEQTIENLLKQAGKRKAPDPSVSQEIEWATRLAWQEAVASHRKSQSRRLINISAIAALLLVSLSVGFFGLLSPAPSPAFASLVNINGSAFLNDTQLSEGENNAESSKLTRGDVLATSANSYLSIKLENGIALSAAENTRFTINSKDEVFLSSGKLYFDSPDVDTALTIRTKQGSIVDVGTQYEVFVSKEHLKISMREGKTILSLPNGEHSAFANDGTGDVLDVDKNYKVSRSSLATTDNYWRWVLKASDTISLEGKSVSDVLEQVARLTGRTVVYSSAEVQQIAKGTRLSGGSIDPEFIEASLPFLLKTTSLAASLHTDRIEVDSVVSIQ